MMEEIVLMACIILIVMVVFISLVVSDNCKNIENLRNRVDVLERRRYLIVEDK